MENITQTPSVEQPSIQESIKPAPSSKTPLIVMVVIAALSLIMVGYLGYQNYLLRQQISQIQTTPTPDNPQPSPTADPTDGWITFSNSSWGVLFKYPKDFGNLTQGGSEYLSGSDIKNVFLRVSRTKYYESLPPDLYSSAINIGVGENPGENKSNLKIADLKIGTHKAALISMSSLQGVQEPPSFQYVYIVKDNDHLILLTFWSQDGEKSKENVANQSQLFEQIFSTLQFTGE